MTETCCYDVSRCDARRLPSCTLPGPSGLGTRSHGSRPPAESTLWADGVRRNHRDRILTSCGIDPELNRLAVDGGGTRRDIRRDVAWLTRRQDQLSGTRAVPVENRPPVLRDGIVCRIREPFVGRQAVVEAVEGGRQNVTLLVRQELLDRVGLLD